MTALEKLTAAILKMEAECKQHQRIYSEDVLRLISLMVDVLREKEKDEK